jgi:hypothetical protein
MMPATYTLLPERTYVYDIYLGLAPNSSAGRSKPRSYSFTDPHDQLDATARKETIMLKLTISYTRYVLAALATIGFALSMN